MNEMNETEESEGRQTILIVDDSPVNLQMLGKLLNDEWRVKVANNGKTALNIASSDDPPDLILLDVMMPEIDGYTICRILKASPETRDIPIIFVTALNQADDEARGLAMGAIDYITKPYNNAVVKARVRNHLELKLYRDLLKNTSLMDGLTGIANRRRFDETIQAEWKRAFRDGHPLALLMVDIDFFKNFNDAYGHQMGDDCLRQVALALAQNLKRPGDLAARYGGEEFACILPDVSTQGVKKIAQRVRMAIKSLRIPHEASSAATVVTVSVGATSIMPGQETGWEVLVERADQALYKAKRQGRNQVAFFGDSEEDQGN
ncbi:PleD family two-component system response regulator [Anoxynatronum buryatiense]|uniref:Stage 0 sporulation protein A homolog n=1 Tax=Anoxynatronum buryatiense TaxID=489973 RepID=A0AA45WVS8_9CLOT|nr:PleD family two-component system response regulator [Anoxynatronum buryatiense]SMP53667.1 response regulator receiver modulated diguanylate cyclase [Anoxynatronum buryatiense]